MIKRQQQWVALLVMAAFVWMLHVSAMPLAASAPGETGGSSSIEQGPDYYEAVALKAAPAKKKSILPWILVGVGVLAITAAVLFFFVLKSYDITGSWNFVFTSGSHTESYVLVFSGDKKSGTFLCPTIALFAGTYSVDGKKATMLLTYLPQVQFSGAFTATDEMSGTWIANTGNFDWTATRGAAAASLTPAPAVQSRLLAE